MFSQRSPIGRCDLQGMKITNVKPTSATALGLGVIAILLVLASTGGAVAGALVTGKQIKDGSVTGADTGR